MAAQGGESAEIAIGKRERGETATADSQMAKGPSQACAEKKVHIVADVDPTAISRGLDGGRPNRFRSARIEVMDATEKTMK